MWKFVQAFAKVSRPQSTRICQIAVRDYSQDGGDNHPESRDRLRNNDSSSSTVQKNLQLTKFSTPNTSFHHSNTRNEKNEHESTKKKTTSGSYWSEFCKRVPPIEAIGWSYAVIVGLQLSFNELSRITLQKYEQLTTKAVPNQVRRVVPSKIKIKSKGKKSTLINSGVSISNSNEVTHQKCDKNASNTEDDSQLSDAMRDFEGFCKKYVAIRENIIGLQALEKGKIETAVKHWKESSILGYAKANFNLALCYETGHGVGADVEKAAHYYQLAADDNHLEAMYNLALLYLNTDPGEATTKEAIYLMEKAAKQGLSQAQTYLGIYHMQETSDMETAAAFFRSAASQNDRDSQYFLGICYEQGWGVDKNECIAADLYMQAGENRHGAALHNLAVFHEYGLGGLPVDKFTAQELYQKSADLGNENARMRLKGFKAREALRLWKEEQKNYEKVSDPIRADTSNKKLNISPSHSSPVLTDLIRDSISVFPVHESPTHVEQCGDSKDKSSRIRFHVGDDGDDDIIVQNKLFSFPSVNDYISNNIGATSRIKRTATLPDLNLIPIH